jgi:hypothetical protein
MAIIRNMKLIRKSAWVKKAQNQSEFVINPSLFNAIFIQGNLERFRILTLTKGQGIREELTIIGISKKPTAVCVGFFNCLKDTSLLFIGTYELTQIRNTHL